MKEVRSLSKGMRRPTAPCSAGFNPTSKELVKLGKELDVNGNGQIGNVLVLLFNCPSIHARTSMHY